MTQPYSLLVRGPSADIFALSDALGFDEAMSALAVSVFEDGSSRVPTGRMFVQALYETRAEAETALAALALPAGAEYSIDQLPDEDWVSKSQSGLPPVSAGRFWVYGSHDAGNIPADTPHPIHIDAGLAFGTGHHGTTKGCLIIFDELLSGGFTPQAILDLGAGAGTLAIAAAMALEQNILATDIDQDAVDVTAQNAALNGVGDKITSIHADGFDSPALDGRTFDLIFANILAGPLMGLAPDIVSALAPGGKVILSGIIDDLANKVAKRFEHEGLTVTPSPSIDGWTSLLGEK